eukprot:TRINITY_DN103840_c0_g1_i1.p1 TRINITY_DN103840_c0_g1~~TRINITY_DN103840_c0_g1_i1.p1  ORF type:complete len:305 (+),score=52.54 TRINITY_DN103840_c0_g1_i1:100-1014(+)
MSYGLAAAALLSGLLICALDCLCVLPHVVASGLLRDVDLRAQCQPASHAWLSYSQHLDDWRGRVSEYLSNETLASLELDGDGTAFCRLAELAVLQRKAGRLQARLQVSSLAHGMLLLRDFLDEGLSPLDVWLRRARVELAAVREDASDATVSQDEVCARVAMDAMVASRELHAAAAAASRAGLSYARETMLAYSGLILMAVFCALVFENGFAWLDPVHSKLGQLPATPNRLQLKAKEGGRTPAFLEDLYGSIGLPGSNARKDAPAADQRAGEAGGAGRKRCKVLAAPRIYRWNPVLDDDSADES